MKQEQQSILPVQQQSQHIASTTTATNTQSMTATATKKKFGKNLTKIVQSQQKIAQADSRSNSHSSKCKNGLLLLSMNKKTSGLLATSEVTNVGSIVNTSGSNSNTVLLNTVQGLGVSGTLTLSNAKEAYPQPDAWGVHTNLSTPNAKPIVSTTTSPPTAGNFNDDSAKQGSQNTSDAALKRRGNEPGQLKDSVSDVIHKESRVGYSDTMALPHHDLKSLSIFETRASTAHDIKDSKDSSEVSIIKDQKHVSKQAAVPSAPWDEYGGRERKSAATGPTRDVQIVVSGDSSVGDPDKEYMAKKAKERALAIQKAEELRFQEQRSRALARLRELNQNQQLPNNNTTQGSCNDSNVDQNTSSKNDGQPNRQETHEHPNLNQPNTLIHLTSYEDRDRGMSAQSSQPRMLFDPKSGAMVAVKAREEQANNLSKSKKAPKKLQDSRGATTKGPTRKDSGTNNITERKPRKGSDGDLAARVQLLKNSNPVLEPSFKVVKKALSPQPPVITRTRLSLPRTCGVLYKRIKAGSNADDSASLICADGCEGDLGYGAHSVPGGRTRNPTAYAKYKLAQQQLLATRSVGQFRNGGKQLQPAGKNSPIENWEGNDAFRDAPKLGLYQRQQMYDSAIDSRPRSAKMPSSTGDNSIQTSMLYTGFNPSHTRDPDDEDGYEFGMQQHLDWVKADDKLELVGLDDEEPTLKPTAKAFAPSQAALAAAATLRTQDSRDSDDEDDSNDLLMGVPGLDDDAEDSNGFGDDEDIDEHHHHTVNKAALDILDDDDYDVDNNIDTLEEDLNGARHHHHLSLDDRLVFGFDTSQGIHELIPNSSKTGTSRLVQLEDLPLEPSSLLVPSFVTSLGHEAKSVGSMQDDAPANGINNRMYNAASHPIFPFATLNPWGTSSGTSQASSNNTTDWDVDILNLTRGGGSSNQGVGGLGNGAGSTSGNHGLFGTTSGDKFVVPGLVSGIPSSTSWGTGGVVVVPAFEGLTINGTVSGRDNNSSKGGD